MPNSPTDLKFNYDMCWWPCLFVLFFYYACLKVVLADWKVKTPFHANGVFINKMLSLNRKKIKFISKRHYLLAHYIVTFRSLIVSHKKAEHCLLVRHTS